MQSLESIFQAKPKSVSDIICKEAKAGYYMPAYQRPYSWNKDNIERLFSDLNTSFQKLLTSNDAIIFLGTILTVKDDGSSVVPRISGQYPNNVQLVVDGQQRLTTLVLMLSALHEGFKVRANTLDTQIQKVENMESSDLSTGLDWLREAVVDALDETSCFMIKTAASDKKYRFQPKIIRSEAKLEKADCWGKDRDKARYNSPVADYLFNYQSHLVDQAETGLVYESFNVTELKNEETTLVCNNIVAIKNQINKFCKGNLNSEEIITLRDLRSNYFVEALDFDLPEVFFAEETKLHSVVNELIYLVALTRFVLNRVCLTYVTVNSESYAFDMFEALNTTGEPLTAFETFVPRVIEFLQSTASEEHGFDSDDLQSLNNRFEKLPDNKKKKKLSDELILTFARLYSGKSIAKDLGTQRNYLLRQYKNCDNNQKNEFLHAIKVASDFIVDNWHQSDISNQVTKKDFETATLCFSYLVALKHTISQAILIFFILKEESNQQEERFHFVETLKAVTAFSVLWRAMTGTTGGIDNVYKNLHENLKPSSVNIKNGLCNFDSMNLKQTFKKALFSKINKLNKGLSEGEKEDWIKVAKEIPILKHSQIAHLLILASLHGHHIENGLVIKEEYSSHSFLDEQTWNNSYNSKKAVKLSQVFEPSINNQGWDNSLLEDQKTTDLLGNLFLAANDDFLTKGSKSTWNEFKSNLERAIGSNISEKLHNLEVGELSVDGIDVCQRTKAKYFYQELSYHDAWTKTLVEERTKRMLSSAWDNLIEWLD